MFSRFARRMTWLYVVVAAAATTLTLSLLVACAIYGYVRLLDETAKQTAVHAFAYGLRAQHLHVPFEKAATAFEREDAHSGIVIFAPQPPSAPGLGGPPFGRPGDGGRGVAQPLAGRRRFHSGAFLPGRRAGLCRRGHREGDLPEAAPAV